MLTLPAELSRRYETLLRRQGVARQYWPHYTKWLHYYWDFCHKYRFEPQERQSFPPFDEKLRAKHQSDFQRQQAHHAVSLYYASVLTVRDGGQRPRGRDPLYDSQSTPVGDAVSIASPVRAATAAPSVRPVIARPPGPRAHREPVRSLPPQTPTKALSPPVRKPVGLPSTTLEHPGPPLPQAIPREQA